MPDVQDPQAAFFLAHILPRMRKRIIPSFGGVVGYDGAFFFALCERMEIDRSDQLVFLQYLEIYEDALLTSQHAQRGEETHGGQEDRTPSSDDL